MEKDFKSYLIVGKDKVKKRNEILAIFDNEENASECYGYLYDKKEILKNGQNFSFNTLELNISICEFPIYCLENPTPKELYKYAKSKKFI